MECLLRRLSRFHREDGLVGVRVGPKFDQLPYCLHIERTDELPEMENLPEYPGVSDGAGVVSENLGEFSKVAGLERRMNPWCDILRPL